MKTISVYVTDEMLAKLKKGAEAEKRKLSDYIRLMLEDVLKER